MVTDSPEDPLLTRLRKALAEAPRPVQEIEVGIPLSILLGRERLSQECGGCDEPLEFEGIPARTVVGLKDPFRLKLSEEVPR